MGYTTLGMSLEMRGGLGSMQHKAGFMNVSRIKMVAKWYKFVRLDKVDMGKTTETGQNEKEAK
jgi:hypothetical protein